MMNPILADLIGGIQSVTLGDEEARRRGTQKSILERMSPPTFNIVVEIQDRDRVAIHPDVGKAVDALLRGQPLDTETRWLDPKTGQVKKERVGPAIHISKKTKEQPSFAPVKQHKLYLYGVNRGRFEQMINEIGLDNVEIVNNPEQSNLFITTKHHYRRKPQKIRESEATNLPIFVLRSNTPTQIRQFLNSIVPTFDELEKPSPLEKALSEAQSAVEQVKNGAEAVELSPQSAYIRRLQHLIAERNILLSKSYGQEPERRVRIFKE